MLPLLSVLCPPVVLRSSIALLSLVVLCGSRVTLSVVVLCGPRVTLVRFEFPLRWSSCTLVVLCPLRRMRVASPHRMLKCVIEFFGSRETPSVVVYPGQEKPLPSLYLRGSRVTLAFFWANSNPRGVRFRLLIESRYVVICSVVWRLSRGSDSQCPNSVFAFNKGTLRMSPLVRIRIPVPVVGSVTKVC